MEEIGLTSLIDIFFSNYYLLNREYHGVNEISLELFIGTKISSPILQRTMSVVGFSNGLIGH